MNYAEKGRWLLYRVRWAIGQTPRRFYRLWYFYRLPFYRQSPKLPTFFLLLTECFGVYDAYDILTCLSKKHVRQLTEAEQLRGRSIFKNVINWDCVLIDPTAKIGCRDKGIAYVSFFTINSWGTLPPDILIHELVHVWQYQQFGAGYIVAALHAQRSKEGYDYTATEGWQHLPSLTALNPEQQADLVQDYFRITQHLAPQWNSAVLKKELMRFVDEIQNGSCVS